MTPFIYERAADARGAIRFSGEHADTHYLGGGTNLVDLMRETIATPHALVDVSGLSKTIAVQDDGSVMIGGAVSNSALAADPVVRERYPVLARALLSGASAQIRNMATVAGNMLQRTRCAYFYDDGACCNKRAPGAGCDAIGGFDRYHAILGASSSCVATHPSDMCVALLALDAMVHVDGPNGSRCLALADLHRLPGDRPYLETTLQPLELITAITLPPLADSAQSTYRKVRDRSSYAFALVSVAAVLSLSRDGNIGDIKLALGGVAHKPWRAIKAENALRGKPATEQVFRDAAESELADAVPLRDNGFKIELAKRSIVAVLSELTGGHP